VISYIKLLKPKAFVRITQNYFEAKRNVPDKEGVMGQHGDAVRQVRTGSGSDRVLRLAM